MDKEDDDGDELDRIEVHRHGGGGPPALFSVDFKFVHYLVDSIVGERNLAALQIAPGRFSNLSSRLAGKLLDRSPNGGWNA